MLVRCTKPRVHISVVKMAQKHENGCKIQVLNVAWYLVHLCKWSIKQNAPTLVVYGVSVTAVTGSVCFV